MGSEIRTLSRAECLDKLAAHSIGRVSVTQDALPVIVPVNYILDGSGVVFRTRGDSLLARACHSNVIAFEVDELARDGSGGWSVLVVGVADALDDSERVRIIGRRLVSAAGSDLDHFVRITMGRLSGREIAPSVVVPFSEVN